ncbi:uncharacterized protein LOC123005585 [Tribolium madens]|uniref:uncharacterized protein LOC123005585 n=1 Tax=Tribolium madens TaxID=41895 RepID=UPI001CF761EB|nr:uncharacterized protein LOC123005585 [Tribolium madens]
MDKDAQDNHANQGNPNNSAYYSSRGLNTGSDTSYTQAEHDNRSKELNPNNKAYYSSRGQQK